jgi:iron complex transport system substrate-binding protein
MRVVSLLPAATEILCALGLRDSLVARSHECDFPADVSGLPALTRARVDSSLRSGAIDEQVRALVASRLPVYTLDETQLSALAPDVVVTQEACEVCAISYEQVAAAVGRVPAARVLALAPARLDDIIGDIGRVAEVCGVPARGEQLNGDLRRRLAQAARRTTVKPRVAVIEWLEPVMLAGHWVPDAIAAAGAIAVGPEPGAASPYSTWDEVRALEPDAVVVAPCGFDLDRTRRESEPFADLLHTLSPRVLLLDGNAYLNRPGPRIVEAVETIAAWLRGAGVPAERGTPLGGVLST